MLGNRILLEVCLESADDALVAAAGGADRVELNAGLALGGLTPSPGAVAAVLQACDLPVIAMLRPRRGGFQYSLSEFEVMRYDLEWLLKGGVAGVAFGILDARNVIDQLRCREIVEASQGRETVFHRAFDLTPDPFESLDALIDLGVTRVLTSGQRATAPEGAELLRRLIQHAGNRIEILPGAGINAHTAPQLIRVSGCNQIHGSFRTTCSDQPSINDRCIRIDATNFSGEGVFERTSAAALIALRQAIEDS